MRTLRGTLVVLLSVFCLFFQTGLALAATAVNLGTAGNFTVLGGSTITNTGPSVVGGDLGLSPGTSVTGFPPGIVNGAQYITDAVAAQAQTDLVTAYNSAVSQSTTQTVSSDLGGLTLTPGVYSSASSLGLTGVLTLDAQGNSGAVFIFQIGSALTTASASSINLINGAQACNVFWQVGSSVTLGTNSRFVGSLLSMQSITATTGTSVNGRLLARNGAVTLDTNAVSGAACAVLPPPTAPASVQLPPPAPTLLAMPVVTPATSATPAITNSAFPNTGIPPANQSNLPWILVLPAGILLLLLSGAFVLKKIII
jgi:hypothetical protein